MYLKMVLSFLDLDFFSNSVCNFMNCMSHYRDRIDNRMALFLHYCLTMNQIFITIQQERYKGIEIVTVIEERFECVYAFFNLTIIFQEFIYDFLGSAYCRIIHKQRSQVHITTGIFTCQLNFSYCLICLWSLTCLGNPNFFMQILQIFSNLRVQQNTVTACLYCSFRYSISFLTLYTNLCTSLIATHFSNISYPFYFFSLSLSSFSFFNTHLIKANDKHTKELVISRLWSRNNFFLQFKTSMSSLRSRACDYLNSKIDICSGFAVINSCSSDFMVDEVHPGNLFKRFFFSSSKERNIMSLE